MRLIVYSRETEGDEFDEARYNDFCVPAHAITKVSYVAGVLTVYVAGTTEPIEMRMEPKHGKSFMVAMRKWLLNDHLNPSELDIGDMYSRILRSPEPEPDAYRQEQMP